MTTPFTINPPRAKMIDANGFVTADWYRWFARIQGVAVTSGNIANGSFLTLGSNPDLPSGRVFTPAAGQLSAVDGGAGGAYTLGLADTAVTPNPYGGASKTVSFTVDAKGRLVAAAEFTLSTTNITEGTNLYYTDARARAALSASAPLSYNSGTGAFTIAGSALTKTDDTNVTLTLGGTPASALLAAASLTLGWTGTLAVSRGGTGAGSMTANALPKGNGTGAYTASNVSDDGNVVSIASGKGFSIARVAVTSPAANDGNVYSGTYTPTLTNVANIDASTAFRCNYIRVGNMVTVSGAVQVDPTAATTNTLLGISLPIASNFPDDQSCSGSIGSFAVAGESGIIRADAANDRAEMAFISTGSANHAIRFCFVYEIV